MPPHHPARLAVVVVILVAAARANAHPDDYIDETFVYQTVERHETELEAWAEVREVRESPADEVSAWYTLAVEFGITERWMADVASQLVSDDSLHFGRLRLETRYRFSDEGTWPIDVATSLEYEIERDVVTGELEQALTPRLVLSKDLVSSVNTTVNLDVPVRLDGRGSASFAYAIGARYPARARFRIGAEVRHDIRTDVATFFPQLWVVPSRTINLVAKLGAGIGLTRETDPWLVRLSLELEL